MQIENIDIDKLSPMMRQYVDIKLKNKDVIIMFRLGDFYEMFFEDAVVVSRELELTLTGKNAGLDERVPMCGVPHHAANIYIEKLVEKGYKVGICEQMEDPRTTKGLVKRDLVNIVSSGTIVDNELLNEKENNYIGSLLDFDTCFVITYADISTGEIYTKLLEHKSLKAVNEIIGLGIKEVIMNDSVDIDIRHILKNQYHITLTVTDEVLENDEYSYVYSDISDDRLSRGIKHILTYISNTQKRNLSHLQKAIVVLSGSSLKMDVHTKRNLELTETLRLKSRNYSLIWLLDKTKTAMGSRLLKNYIENPLIDINEIKRRQNMVEALIQEFILKSDLVDNLLEVYDLERLSGKIAFGNANARDLLQLKRTLKVLPNIREILSRLGFDKNVSTLDDLYMLLERSIYEDAPIGLKEGYLIKDGYNLELDELKSLRRGGKDFIAKFEALEREKTGIKNLKVGYNKVFGYYIEVSRGNVNLVKDEYGYERKQTLTNCERYISPVLKEKEALILNAEEKIVDLEYDLFIEIRDKVKSSIFELQQNAKVISEIDVMQAFATVSEENNYVKPVLNLDGNIRVIDGRHPVVEKVLEGSSYVANDIIMDKNTNILLITGPNMAGKSTYMRQVAIIAIMAQIGCFVPARSASLPVFDAIYTRIGASDDLVSGESTFMVEMMEANNAISNATSNSLVLFDELGRGTATFDGMALAQSIIEYIHDNIKCKTFFSTHYHELTDLENNLHNLRNVHVSAHEENGNITFLHKIKEGSIDKSYGIHVARLASLPDSLIKRASQILEVYESKEIKRDIKIQEALPIDELIDNTPSPVIEKLKSIDVLNTTPMEALKILYDLKENI